MDETSLAWFIQNYINERGQAKLDVFDKVAEKKLASLSAPAEYQDVSLSLAEERAEIEARYEINNWLTDAARRAAQVRLVTHAIKFTHSDAKGSSLFYSTAKNTASQRYLSTASLTQPDIDTVGNAASLDVARLLQTEHHGDSLIAALQRGDDSALQAFARDEEQCAEWANGFKQVLQNNTLASHQRAKQIYFPVGEQRWHLLSPLFSSSLTHAVRQRIVDARFSDESKETGSALKENRWHAQPRIIFNNTAILNFGGTKPQNVSYLNSVRGGKAYLLSCAAPDWQSSKRLPLRHSSVFHSKSDITYLTKSSVAQLKNYLLKATTRNSQDRQQVRRYIDTIIDSVFNYAIGLQNDEKIAGWTQQDDCQLKRAYQLWLDPRRALSDESFRREREAEAWKAEIAWDFGYWLNALLKDEKLNVGETERREWQTSPLFKQRMRECEKMLREVLA